MRAPVLELISLFVTHAFCWWRQRNTIWFYNNLSELNVPKMSQWNTKTRWKHQVRDPSDAIPRTPDKSSRAKDNIIMSFWRFTCLFTQSWNVIKTPSTGYQSCPSPKIISILSTGTEQKNCAVVYFLCRQTILYVCMFWALDQLRYGQLLCV